MVFHWVVRHVRWLARVSGFAHLFDAWLLGWSCVFHRQRISAMEALEAVAKQTPGLQLGVHRFGGTAFVVAGREVGHIHGNGLLDVRLGIARAAEYIAAGRAIPHHVFPSSGWVSFQIESAQDAAPALKILHEAINRIQIPDKNA